MQITQVSYQPRLDGWHEPTELPASSAASQLVLVFGDRTVLETTDLVVPVRARFPQAEIVLCSTGGEIVGTRVLDDAAVITALHFERSTVRAVSCPLPSAQSSGTVGAQLVRELPSAGLRHVLIFSEGLRVNGSALAAGFSSALPASVSVTGALAADGERFERTLVGLNERPTPDRVVAVGLYGDELVVGMGSLGGWEILGAEHVITRSSGNVVFELDGKPALPVYKQLIGSHAYGLPASGLLYPLQVVGTSGNPGVVRTLLGIDETAGSLTFAGDVPEGRRVHLMQANLDRLIDAAGGAASLCRGRGDAAPQFVLLISCIGRKLLLQRRVDEELQSARSVFGHDAAFAGFYSYGELSPAKASATCELHNQTMTITTLSERRP